MTDESNGYPRVLDRQGCIYGQHLAEEITTMKGSQKTIEEKLDKLRQAAWGVTLSLVGATIMMALNIIIK